MNAIRLLLVDDDPLVRADLSLMMGGADDIEIVGEAADGGEVEALVDRTRPSGCGDARTPRRSSCSPPSTPTLRCCGAGFVLKDTLPAEILDAVRRVAAGDPVLSPAVTRQLMEHAAGGAPGGRRTAARDRIGALNDREREVAVAVGRGSSNAEVAAELYMSVATVKTHVSRILAKLGLNNRVQIALLTYDAGLLGGDGH